MENETQQQEPRIKRRRGGPRKKTGCSSCKARHTRCDEKKPICSNCERLGLECVPSEFISKSEWCPLDKDEPRRRESMASSAISPVTIRPFSPSTSTWDILRFGLPELNCSSSSAFASSKTSSSPTPPTTGADLSLQNASHTAVRLSPQMVFLLNEFRKGLATWMDLFDHRCTYQREVCRRALTSELILRCVCAFTARQLCHLDSGDVWAPVAREHYSQSLNLLLKQLSNPEDPNDEPLTAVILLSSYELLAAPGQEHRQHYTGAMKLIKMHAINAKSQGLQRANFWIWIRHEIFIAIINMTPLQIAPQFWDVHWREGEMEEDLLGNQILWLTGRAIELVYGQRDSEELQNLMTDIERWYSSLSTSFRGVKYGEILEDGLCKVHFAVSAAAAAMIWYHSLHILLYAEPVLQDLAYSLRVREHAAEIICISISDVPNEARCFSIAPLHLAGKHVDGISRKMKVCSLLERIEKDLGYHTQSLVESLQRLLGSSS